MIIRPAFDDKVAIHTALTAIMAWFGLLLSMPGSTFTQGRGWDRFAAIASEEAWATVFGAVAIFGLLGLTTLRTQMRLASVMILSTAHGCVAIMMYLGSPLGSGSGTYAIVASLGYYLIWSRTREGI